MGRKSVLLRRLEKMITEFASNVELFELFRIQGFIKQ